jgi:gliding motility-associated-like protein
MWGPSSAILFGGEASEVIVSVDQDTEITLSMVDSQTGCQFDTSFMLTASSVTATIVADPGTEINLGESVDLTVGSDGVIIDYDWSDPALNGPNVTVSPEETTTYTVIVTDENGCTAQASITITVRQPLCDETDVFLPNAFTPNNDGINDVLLLRSNFVREMELIIYDRWGKEVFSSTNQNNGWDGTRNGEALASDAYAYYLRVLCINDVEYIKQGNVSLLR